jgi:hypothetical protein
MWKKFMGMAVIWWSLPTPCIASKNVIETLDVDFVYGLPKILGRSLYVYLHLASKS